MPDPLFDSRSSRFDLPYLFAGQSQKEGFVNEVTARLDSLVHLAIESQANTPPASPADGMCWLVGATPTGDWTGHAGKIACRNGGNWLFVVARDGMRLLDRATGQEQRFFGTWKVASRPAAPSGGTTIDSEARSAIISLIASLTEAGVIPPT